MKFFYRLFLILSVSAVGANVFAMDQKGKEPIKSTQASKAIKAAGITQHTKYPSYYRSWGSDIVLVEETKLQNGQVERKEWRVIGDGTGPRSTTIKR